MFGLMKSRACAMTMDEKNHRRLHYCGTCKTLGRLYGQKSRLALNYDTVFLAEILTALTGEDERISQWSRAYQSYNCLSLPRDPDQMPIALRYAATATVVLAQFKVSDHIADTGKLRWRAARRLFSNSFQSAAMQMSEWDFPFDELRHHLQKQTEVEAEISKRGLPASPDEILNLSMEPTAIATAMVMRHGARLIAMEESAEAIYRLGYSFGALVYLLDALEDYEKDFREKQFNALGAAFGISEGKLPKPCRDQVIERLRRLASEVESAIIELPISRLRAEAFALRLKNNLSTKLGIRLKVLTRACEPKPKLKLAGRWRQSIKTAKALTSNQSACPEGLIARLQAPLLFASVLPVAFILPQQAATATSYRECMGMALNLMLIGSVFAAAKARRLHPSTEIGPGLGEGEAGGEASGSRRGRRGKAVADDTGSHWCYYCDCCDCCDCGDSCHCCDSCDCCCCDS